MEVLKLSNGQTVRIDQLFNEPFDYPAFVEGLTSGTKVHVKGNDAEGRPVDEDILLKLDELPFLCLVLGGVLPPHSCQAAQSQYLLDRNVINSDSRLTLAAATFDNSAATINPIMSCFEHNKNKPKEFQSLKDDYLENVSKLRSKFQNAKILDFSDEDLQKVYDIRIEMESEETKEVEYLVKAAPFLANVVGAKDLNGTLSKLCSAAQDVGLEQSSVTFLCTLQILYEVSEKHRQPGRKVLKPIKDMSSDDTYNGMSDLRQLKLFSFAKSVLNIDGVFLTDDKNLALLWTGLNMTGVSPNEISMTPSKLLFSRADGGELENLFNSL